MKKTIKIALLVISLLTVLSLTNNVFASDIKQSADNFIEKGEQEIPITTQEVWNQLLPIAQILVTIGSIVLVICFMYLGLKYMMADPSGKADVKQKLIGLVIATVVIYGGIGIFTILVNLMNSILA